MISLNIEEALAKLEQQRVIIEKKMKNMVVGFAYELTSIASDNTPYGDTERYLNLYKLRQKVTGIEPEAGFHMGAWKYSESRSIAFDSNIYTPEEAAGYAKQDSRTAYKLGDKFYIGAKGPAFALLENGFSPKAPQGIMAPTLSAITGAYAINYKMYFDQAVR